MSVLPAIAVINEDKSRTAVWHVDTGPTGQQMGRLCGAWVTKTDKLSPQVLRGRLLFTHPNFQRNSVLPVVAGLIDVSATLANIKAWIAKYDGIHAASRTPKGEKRAPMTWPSLPDPLDWEALPEPPSGVVKDKLMADTIVASMWVADLAARWSAIETLRLSRSHLRHGESEQRDLPFTVTEGTGRGPAEDGKALRPNREVGKTTGRRRPSRSLLAD